MSTNNFYYENMLQVIEVENEYDVADLIGNAKSELTVAFSNGYEQNDWEQNGLRSYPGKRIFTVPVNDLFFVDVIVRSGYYSGANIDYTIRENDVYNDDYENSAVYKKSLAQAQKIGTRIVKIVSGFTTKLNHLATMSNGEAVYELAK